MGTLLLYLHAFLQRTLSWYAYPYLLALRAWRSVRRCSAAASIADDGAGCGLLARDLATRQRHRVIALSITRAGMGLI